MLMGLIVMSMLLGAAAVVVGAIQQYWILLPMAGLIAAMSYFGKKALKRPEREAEPESLEDRLHRRKMELVAAKRASGLVKYDYGLVDLERELKEELDAIDAIWSK